MNIVVVGAGLAGAKAVEELRTQGYDGDITLIGAEPHPPYERPPLSKALLLGTATSDSVFVHSTQWYIDQQVEFVAGARVTDIDLDRGHVDARGRQWSYDRLLLCTGATPRRFPLADQSGADIVYLRTLEDALDLKARLAGHVLIVGAGWIGLEVAAAARQANAIVTVVETAALPLVGVLGPEIAPVFANLHRDHGVDLRLGTSIAAIEQRAGTTTVRLRDGHEVTPHVILVGIGAEPNFQLGANAGLVVDHGILVDARLRASDPHVFAAGDVANHAHPVLGRIRVEHWDTAIHQGRHAARNMLGQDDPYTRQPYFFTDQYDLGMEYVGHVGPGGYDEVVIRGDLFERVFTALWIKHDRVVAGMHVNDWGAIDALRNLVGNQADRLAHDPDVALVDLPGATPVTPTGPADPRA
jgi:3-phenylpropionate/trans-cinnamate dioxygenase ferredoxin reductase component